MSLNDPNNINVTVEVRLQELQLENLELKRKLDFFLDHPQARSIEIEYMVCNALNARLERSNKYCDIRTNDGSLLEIKYSSGREIKSTRTLRWEWSKIFGINGSKTFDYLLLIAKSEPKFNKQYKAQNTSLLYFLLPFEAVQRFAKLKKATNGTSTWRIYVNSNPKSQAKSTFSKDFFLYEKTLDELKKQFSR